MFYIEYAIAFFEDNQSKVTSCKCVSRRKQEENIKRTERSEATIRRFQFRLLEILDLECKPLRGMTLSTAPSPANFVQRDKIVRRSVSLDQLP